MSKRSYFTYNNVVKNQQVLFNHLNSSMLSELIHRTNEKIITNDINNELIKIRLIYML